jgi:glycosyltransferase involved in cell wall biosynthesis
VLTFTNTKKTTIALCVIAKNEEDMIGGCLDSVRDLVDEIVVVDTGSTDRTVEIAREHGARVEHFDWINDFAAARNAAIDAASTDWILMLDADERLAPESGQFLSQAVSLLPADSFGYALQIENLVGDTTMAHFMTRLFPKRDGLRFVGSIHEELTPPEGEVPMVTQLAMVRIIHYGYEPTLYTARGKDARNMRLLEQELERTPDSARLLYYIMQQHCARRRYEEALPYAERFLLHKAQMRFGFEIEIYRMWLESLFGLGRWEEAEEVLSRAASVGAVSAYAYEMCGIAEEFRGRPAEALAHFHKARQGGLPEGLWARPTGDEWKMGTRIADCEWALGHYKRALTELEHVLPEVPAERRAPIALEAVSKSYKEHQYAAAYRWTTKAHELVARDNLKLHLEIVDAVNSIPARTSRTGDFAALDRAVASHNWQAVYDEARQIPLDSVAGLARLLRVADGFISEGAADAALDVVERTLDAFPQEQLVYWTLIRALNALGRHEDAAGALAVLESLQISRGELPIAA